MADTSIILRKPSPEAAIEQCASAIAVGTRRMSRKLAAEVRGVAAFGFAEALIIGLALVPPLAIALSGLIDGESLLTSWLLALRMWWPLAVVGYLVLGEIWLSVRRRRC